MSFPRAERKNDSHITFCKFFSEGNCIYGNTCRYPHIGDEKGGQRPTLPSTGGGSGSTQPITLLVENIPPGTKEDDLMHLFSSYGSTKDVRFIEKSETGFSRAHVDMIGKESVSHAMAELNQWDNPNQLQVSIIKGGGGTGGPIRGSSSLMKVGGYSSTVERPRYAVPTTSQPDLSLYKTVPCKYYAQGACSYGLSCTFFHSGTDVPSATVNYPPPPSSYSSSSYQNAQPYQYIPYPIQSQTYSMPSRDNRDTARESRYASNASKYKTVPCVLFASGKCTFGDKCNFIHGATEATATSSTTTTAAAK